MDTYRVLLFDQKNKFIGSYHFGEILTHDEVIIKINELVEGYLKQVPETKMIIWEIIQPIDNGVISK